jgi:predicted MFS family arabinose efflux permease
LRDYLGGAWSHLKNIRVLGLLSAGTITFIIIYGTLLTYLTLLIDERFSASSFVIGLTITAMSLTTAAVSSQLGRLNRRFSLSTIIVTAFVLYAIALFLIPHMPSLGLLFLPMLVFGAGQGMNIPSLQTAVAGLAPIEYRAAFMSINATMLRLGQTLGPPLIALVYVQGGYNATFYVSSVIAIVTAAVGLAGRGIVNRRRPSPGPA